MCLHFIEIKIDPVDTPYLYAFNKKPDLEKSGLHPCYENRNVISIKDDANLKLALMRLHDERHTFE